MTPMIAIGMTTTVAETVRGQIPTEKFTERLKSHQIEFLQAFDSGSARFFSLEWHRGGYKTTTVINLLIRECIEHPRHKYVYVAPTQVMAREIVWNDPNMLNDALPDKSLFFWKRNEQQMTITFENGSVLKIGGADNPDSIRGIDADGGASDEHAQHKPNLWPEILRPIIARRPKPGCRKRFWIFIYTPKGPNHATMQFNTAACIADEGELPIKGASKKHRKEWFASRLCADVSGVIPQQELKDMLQEVEDGLMPLSLYEQEMLCKRVTDEERTLITSSMLERLKTRNWDSIRHIATEMRRIVAIDPAFGGDICSIKGIENGRVVKQKKLHFGGVETLTHTVVYECKLMAKEIGTNNFIVDCIGNGKGVADGLAIDEMKYNVQYFESAGLVENSRLYANKKAEAVNFVAGKIARCEVEPIEDYETRRQLVYLSRYKVTNRGLMIMRPNDEVKKDLGCSPDDGLCYVYGIYGLSRVSPEIVGERTLRKQRGIRKSPFRF